MIRWLKDKKKDKRTSSTSQTDGGKEDDYGFGKEKSASKSPSSRRQLPPTPATPEEKSPHIYEEIPDLPLCCMLDNEKTLLQNRFNKSKIGCTSSVGTMPEATGTGTKSGVNEKDDISPYMVVPVDNEVRQTPTDFHRNGTPEVHCDVIVKDTHCEILLTRKPKVGAFRLDNTALSVTGKSDGDKRCIRNNTHFCSRDRRATAYVGNLSSAFSVTSSAFSSSTASKIPSGGASSSMALINANERLETCDESDNNDESEKGVTTYSTVSNVIPRSTTKLIFNPLPGKNPCKEAFGSDSSDELHCVGYSPIKDNEVSVGGTSAWEHQSGSKCVTYASLQSNDIPEPSLESHVTYASVHDQHFADTKLNPNYSFDDIQSNFSLKHLKNRSNSPNDNTVGFGDTARTGTIRPASPSTTSNCIYALVTFPTGPKHYNTIAEITASGIIENGRSLDEDINNVGVTYSCLNESFGNDIGCPPSNRINDDSPKLTEAVCCGKMSFHLNGVQSKTSQASCFDFNERAHPGFNVERIRFDSSSVNYSGVSGRAELSSDSSCVQQGSCAKGNSEFPNSSDHNLELEFCFCSDEHSSSCGCPDTKHNQDDDAASVAGATGDGPNSCLSCGRLIRQITYSESYSDETYEHVYSSRLLIRTGRRFSSPDITVSEANSEFHDIQTCRSPDFPYAVSRDDSWTPTRGSDIIPPSYSAAARADMANTVSHLTHVKKRNSDDALICNDSNREQLQDNIKHAENRCTGSRAMPTCQTLRCTSISGSKLAATKHPNFLLDDELCDLKTENNSVSDVTSLEKSVVVSNCVSDPAIEQSRKRDAMEPKTGAFTGLLSKFSRTKSSKSAKSEPSEMFNICTTLGEKSRQIEVSRCDKDLEDIPEKNTRKLSKFFQRLSSKEQVKCASDCVTTPEIDDQASAVLLTDVTFSGKTPSFNSLSLQHYAASQNSQKCVRDIKQITGSHTGKGAENVSRKNSTENVERRLESQTHKLTTKSQSCLSGSTSVSTSVTDQLSSENNNAKNMEGQYLSVDDASNSKLQFKTDSGDTCYEYDISTSSEGEQTGYESFLSKVKKTLNLEHEVHHIAESGAVRRKRLCKVCKRDGLYSSIDEDEEGAVGGDGFCTHLAAKFGDLRAIFEDLVVDQRAAILDCLTDYNLSPYNTRGHGPESYCRECRCEMLTSDTESLTTVSSLLSQQFRMTSPNGQTLSCDSDEGTMADNSCESADDDRNENGEKKSNSNKNHYDGNSSGYDEPKEKLGSVSQRSRKKERKDKRSVITSCTHAVSKDDERHVFTLPTDIQDEVSSGSNFRVPVTEESINIRRLKDVKEATISSSFSDCHRKSILKKNTQTTHSHGANSKGDNLDHSKICDISRSKVGVITDKVLQDIYAPLPYKAMSLLTSRNYGFLAGLSCPCGRGLQTSLATVTSHLATGKPITPPTGSIKGDNFLMPSPASLTYCNNHQKDEVVPVQKHSERDGKNSNVGELVALSERKDAGGSKSDQHTMGVHHEKEALGCSPALKNGESNDCLASQTKPGNRTIRNERASLSAKDESPLRSRPQTKQPYETGIKIDCGLITSSLHEMNKRAQMSLPHTTKDSIDQTFTADGIVDCSDHSCPENPYNEIYERSFVELKTESAKNEYTRKHRLGLVALDLLPESAVDGETIEATNKLLKPRRSKVIENIAKMFESSSESSSKKKAVDLTTQKNNSRVKIKNAHSNKAICTTENPSQISQDNLVSKVVESATNIPPAIPHSKRRLPGTNLTRQDNLCGRPENYNLNFNEDPPGAENTHLLAISKTIRSRSGSKQGRDNETKSVKSDIESCRLKTNELKCVKGKTGKTKSSSSSYSTESKLVKQRSDTPSSSSVSSSSSSRRRSSHTKHKVSKKSYHRKRSKQRSERTKNGHGKEERTYYYFSSDFSDIDVVEVGNMEQFSPGKSTDTSRGNIFTRCKKRSVSSDEIMLTNSSDPANPRVPSPNNPADAGVYEQEVYALPSNSSDLRSRNNSNDMVNSPQPSPEISKIRKMKRTDVYKSRKSNNKLLSDVIIRNYDMQVYGNV